MYAHLYVLILSSYVRYRFLFCNVQQTNRQQTHIHITHDIFSFLLLFSVVCNYFFMLGCPLLCPYPPASRDSDLAEEEKIKRITELFSQQIDDIREWKFKRNSHVSRVKLIKRQLPIHLIKWTVSQLFKFLNFIMLYVVVSWLSVWLSGRKML